MGENGPGEDLDAQVDAPLDPAQLANVLATAEEMSAQERLLFLSSLVRFVLKICHQVSVALSAADRPQSEMPDMDDFGLVQTSMVLLDKAQVTLNQLQTELDKGTHKNQRAKHLRQALQHRWGEALQQSTIDVVQNLLALLVVYEEEMVHDGEEQTEGADSEWVGLWERQLHGYLEELLCPMPSLSLTMPINVESQGSSSSLQQAAALQRSEDEIMAAALAQPTCKRRRMQMDVTITSGASSSTTRMHVACPTQNEPITVQLQMQVRESTMREDDEEVTLMQTTRTRPLFAALLPQARRRLALRLAQLLQLRSQHLLRECHMVLREQRDLQRILMDVEPGATTTSEDAEVPTDCYDTLATTYLSELQHHIDNLLLVESDATNEDIITQMMELLGRFPDQSIAHERTPLTTRPTEVGTEAQCLKLANMTSLTRPRRL